MKSYRLWLSTAALCCLGGSALLRAQAPAVALQAPEYDVATIRLSKGSDRGITMNTRLFGVSATGVTLIYLLEQAYGMPGFLITGIPREISNARFDVNAKVVDLDEAAMRALTSGQRRDMLRRLLVERFSLKVHTEEKEMRVYDLVATRGAAKLTPTTKLDSQGAPMRSASISTSDGVLNARSATCADLATALSGVMRHPVVDKTGIEGRFDVSLRWSPEEKPGVNPDSPTLSTELDTRIGFRLRPDTGAVTTLVIDSASLPTAN